MGSTIKGRRKDRTISDIDALKLWAKWMRLNMLPEDEVAEETLEHLRCVESVCSQVGTWKAKHDKLQAQLALADKLAAVVDECLMPTATWFFKGPYGASPPEDTWQRGADALAEYKRARGQT